jgi:pimeloyl-ACP methyl ester carboxylesterase
MPSDAKATSVPAAAPGTRAAGPLAIERQGFFYAGGERKDGPAGSGVFGQMFVEYQIPAVQTSPYPIVLIHGNFQNGSNFLGTPDDRQGWAEYFLRRGYAVYVVDQPARGRSSYNVTADGDAFMLSTSGIEQRFTAISAAGGWPQAGLHTQWPGTGQAGDPVFDQFEASQQVSLSDNVRMDALNRAAGAALLKRIGPSILLTHSRSGAIGWVIADDVPDLVKGIVAIEPVGAPFYDMPPMSGATPKLSRAWGIAFDRLTYDPPVAEPAAFDFEQEAVAHGPDLHRCFFPKTPRRLVNLAGIPILILTGEASYHAPYDHCTAEFLTRCGVANDFVPLADKGIHGNGHMMMLEKNNLEIAAVIADWIAAKVT